MKFVVFSLLLFGLFACNSAEVTYLQNFETSKWNKFHSVECQLPIEKVGKYQTKVRFTFDKTFVYSDIKIQYERISPSGESQLSYHTIPVIQSKKLKRTFDKNGNNVIEYVLFSSEAFSEKGSYSFIVDNMMPKFETEGVVSFELLIKSI